MVDAAIGHGLDFKRGDGGSPTTFSTVGEITSLTAPTLTRDAVEKTHTQSPERWREFLGGLKDGGEVTAELNFDPADATTTSFLNDVNTNTLQEYQIEWPNGTTWEFFGLITGFEPGAPLDDRMTASVTLKLSGKPTFIA